MLDLRSDEEKIFYDFIDNTNDNGIRKIDRHTQLYPTEDMLTEQFNNHRELKLKSLVSSFKIEIENNLCKSGIDKTAFLNRHLQKATKYKNQWISISKKISDTPFNLDSTKPYIMQNVVFLIMVVQFLEENLGELTNYKIQSPIAGIEASEGKLHFNLKENKQATQKQILELYKKLKKGKFIEGTATQFKAIFNLSDFDKPVIWVSGKANELLYFYFKLENTDIIKNTTNQHQILKHHLIKKDGLLFDENFKQIYYKIKNEYTQPVRANEIDVCFNFAFTL